MDKTKFKDENDEKLIIMRLPKPNHNCDEVTHRVEILLMPCSLYPLWYIYGWNVTGDNVRDRILKLISKEEFNNNGIKLVSDHVDDIYISKG